MTAIEPFVKTGRRWMGWNTGIWLLAAGLGATAVASTVGIVHENAQRHIRANAWTRSRQIEAARERLEILAYEKLAPVKQGYHLVQTEECPRRCLRNWSRELADTAIRSMQ